MKTYPYIFILSFFFIFQSCGNRLHNWRYVDRCLKCKENNSLTVEQRNEEFQFKNSTKIVYASFPQKVDSDLEDYFDEIDKDYSKFNLKDFHETKFLNINEINNLSYLIYNYGFRKNINAGRSSNCYFPNNAILFLNDDNSLLGYIEICFDCHKYRTSGENYTLGEECSQKVNKLKELFVEAGITYISALEPFK